MSDPCQSIAGLILVQFMPMFQYTDAYHGTKKGVRGRRKKEEEVETKQRRKRGALGY